jgi:hypothetical protein
MRAFNNFKIDSAVSSLTQRCLMTPLSLTQRCQWHRWDMALTQRCHRRFETRISSRFGYFFRNYFRMWIKGLGEMFNEKTRVQKSRETVPLSLFFHSRASPLSKKQYVGVSEMKWCCWRQCRGARCLSIGMSGNHDAIVLTYVNTAMSFPNKQDWEDMLHVLSEIRYIIPEITSYRHIAMYTICCMYRYTVAGQSLLISVSDPHLFYADLDPDPT